MQERLRFLEAPGPWLWIALALGAALRVYCVGWTEGSFDVAIKQHHGTQVGRLGLMGWYRAAEVFNHPPLMGEFFAGLVTLADASGVPFRVLLRAPFALLDFGTALLLWRLLRERPERWLVAAAYWLHPLAVIFSSYHGNTDSALACIALASVVLASTGRSVAAGVALGVGFWIKLPIVLAAPAIVFAFPHWRARVRCAVSAAIVGSVTYLPALLVDPVLVFQRIVGYPGTGVVTPGGIAVWGIAHTLRLADTAFAAGLEAANTAVCFLPLLAYAWWRRGRLEPCELAASVAGCFLILYGFTSFWAWQYLAWSIPFLLCRGRGFAIVSSVVLGSYVYGAYAFFTGSPWLQGRWDFASHSAWPPVLALLRDASVLLCFGAACGSLLWAGRDEWRRWRRATP
ncbi:MAG: DUF2029 domain-containing protein [Deltaproteobacteria bacterium]|nr:DUF2029 domain-containing protein [Deltaproteobacteria bacterium]MBW2360026.1 DUF2029 domain-containing protein [Deltaproteobacteria bacterium]